jgi:hypothetical protein
VLKKQIHALKSAVNQFQSSHSPLTLVIMSSSSSSESSAPVSVPVSISSQFKHHQPSSFCIKKGKWYDFLRPVPGYTGFGGIDANRKHYEGDDEDEEPAARIEDYASKAPKFFKSKGKAST